MCQDLYFTMDFSSTMEVWTILSWQRITWITLLFYNAINPTCVVNACAVSLNSTGWLDRFRSLAPQAAPHPTPLPPQVSFMWAAATVTRSSSRRRPAGSKSHPSHPAPGRPTSPAGPSSRATWVSTAIDPWPTSLLNKGKVFFAILFHTVLLVINCHMWLLSLTCQPSNISLFWVHNLMIHFFILMDKRSLNSSIH